MQQDYCVTRGMDPNNVHMSYLDAPKSPSQMFFFTPTKQIDVGPDTKMGLFCRRRRLYNLVTPFMYLEAVQEWDRECDTRW